MIKFLDIQKIKQSLTNSIHISVKTMPLVTGPDNSVTGSGFTNFF